LNCLNDRLKIMRRAGQYVCERLVKSRRDIIAVLIVGSVARGNIRETSDIDMCVIVNEGDKPQRENIQELDYKVDVVLCSLEALDE